MTRIARMGSGLRRVFREPNPCYPRNPWSSICGNPRRDVFQQAAKETCPASSRTRSFPSNQSNPTATSNNPCNASVLSILQPGFPLSMATRFFPSLRVCGSGEATAMLEGLDFRRNGESASGVIGSGALFSDMKFALRGAPLAASFRLELSSITIQMLMAARSV